MGYLMSHTGSTPIGELYISPGNDNAYYLRVHYYSGGDVTLLKIKRKSGTPSSDSVEGNMQKIEGHMDKYFEKLINFYVARLENHIDEYFETAFNDYMKKIVNHMDKYFEKVPTPGYRKFSQENKIPEYKKFKVSKPEVSECYTFKKYEEEKNSYPVKSGPGGINMDYVVENIDTYHNRM